jgi:ribosomal protein L13
LRGDARVVCADVERQGRRLTVYDGIEKNHSADGVEGDAVRLRFIGNR